MRKLMLLCGMLISLSTVAQTGKEILYVGTYSVRNSKGIYVFELNRAKGTLKLIQTVSDLENPSFLAVHPSGKYLYSVNESTQQGFGNSGSASAYKIDPQTGKLTLINHVSSYGEGPCHISIDKTGEWAFISNYNEGNFVVLPILRDGSLGAPADSKKYYGSSINKDRQENPHIHSSEITKDNKFVYVSDLGTDKIYTYAFDEKEGKITATGKGEVSLAAGAGPRHLAVHPSGTHVFSAEELYSTVGVLEINKTTGELNIAQDTVKSLAAPIPGNTSAHILTDPSGNFLYMSNRGADVISIFSISNGQLTFKGTQSTLGKTPRNFLIDRQGKYLWAVNQNSDNLTVFKVNPTTGKLTYTGLQYKIPAPVCVKQLKLK